MTLASTDPFAFPIIDPAFLTTDFDVFAMREAVKSAKEFVAAPAWKNFVVGPAGDFAKANTDSEIE